MVADPDPHAHSLNQGHILEVLRQPQVVAFILGCFLMQAGHGPYYAFYSIYMEDIGFSKTLIGGLWALGVIAEVLVFLVLHRLLSRYGARWVLIVSFLLAALRWLLVAFFPQHLWLMLLAQLLHAATFGTFHAAAISFVDRHFVGRHQGRGQALYSSLSFGAGGAVGSLVSGVLWEPLGPMNTFLIAAALSLLAAVIAWVWMDQDRP
jgi:PPP family 3-phenylpropionic acid transporter